MEEVTDIEDLDLTALEEAYYRELMESEDIMLEGGGFYQTFKSCFWPTVSQTADAVIPLLGLCFIIRVIALTRVPRVVVHFVSIVTGVASLYMFCKRGSLYCLALSAVGYVILILAPGYRGRLMAALTVTFMMVW